MVFYIAGNGDTVAALTDSMTITSLSPGDTLDFTGAENTIIPPALAVFDQGFTRTTRIDDTVAISDSILTLAAIWAVSSKNHPLEYQYSWQPGPVFSSWSADSSIRIVVNPNATYWISCRARSAKDHSAVSSWTSRQSIFIRRLDSTIDSLTVPAAPLVVLSNRIGDTLIFKLSSRQVQSLGEQAHLHRFGWGIMSSDTNPSAVTPWSTDTFSTVSIVHVTTDTTLYRFYRQVRGTQSDSLLVSPCSPATMFMYR
jgi:hypothetical protein